MDALCWPQFHPSTDLSLSAHLRVLCVVSSLLLLTSIFLYLYSLPVKSNAPASSASSSSNIQHSPPAPTRTSTAVPTTIMSGRRPNKRARYLDQQASSRPRSAASGSSNASDVIAKAKYNLGQLFDSYRGKLHFNLTSNAIINARQMRTTHRAR